MNQPDRPIRIAVADDQHLFRQSLCLLISSVHNFQLVAEAENGAALLEKIAEMRHPPDIALIDLNMPGINGVEVNKMLHHLYPSIKVIVLTIYSRAAFIVRAVEDGAAGYLLKNCDKEELVTAINSAMKTGFYLNQLTLQAIRNASLHKIKVVKNFNNIPVELTQREKEILVMICHEYNNAEIAKALFLSVRTVEGHRNNLLLKVGCRNSAGLVVFAVRYELFQVPFA